MAYTRERTVHQPSAWAIVEGLKPVENRTWAARYRGPILIHASRRIDPAGRAALEAAGIDVPPDDELVTSAILGRVDLVDVIQIQKTPGPGGLFDPPAGDPTAHPLATGPECWVLANPRRLRQPIPMPGRQGFWDYDAEPDELEFE